MPSSAYGRLAPTGENPAACRRPAAPAFSRSVGRQGDVSHASVAVGLRHLVEQSPAEPRYWREEMQVARAWRQIHDRLRIDRAVARAEGSNANHVSVMQHQLAGVARA